MLLMSSLASLPSFGLGLALSSLSLLLSFVLLFLVAEATGGSDGFWDAKGVESEERGGCFELLREAGLAGGGVAFLALKGVLVLLVGVEVVDGRLEPGPDAGVIVRA